MKTILRCRQFGRCPGIMRQILRFVVCLAVVTGVFGCGLGGKPSYLAKQYILEYSSPRVEGIVQSEEVLSVEHFSVAREFDTQSMVYRDGPYQRGVDPYNRWRVNPGDMVTDYLLRDLRKAGLFRAVFSYNGGGGARYLLEGQVTQFLESKEKEGRKAVLGTNVILHDLTKSGISERIVFQRSYQYAEPLEMTTCECLAQAMSKAMERFSMQLITDIQQTVSP